MPHANLAIPSLSRTQTNKKTDGHQKQHEKSHYFIGEDF